MEEIEPIYNNYLNIQKELSHDVTVSIQNLIKNQHIDLDNSYQLVFILLLICSLSNQYKMIAERILDTFYETDEENNPKDKPKLCPGVFIT